LGLKALHENGVIYRDLKPENIMLDKDGNISLTDFGISKILNEEGERSISFCGTFEYLAPEIITRSNYGKEVDYWSLVSQTFHIFNLFVTLGPCSIRDARWRKEV
jgi:serine/threonine protein kinase